MFLLFENLILCLPIFFQKLYLLFLLLFEKLTPALSSIFEKLIINFFFLFLKSQFLLFQLFEIVPASVRALSNIFEKLKLTDSSF